MFGCNPAVTFVSVDATPLSAPSAPRIVAPQSAGLAAFDSPGCVANDGHVTCANAVRAGDGVVAGLVGFNATGAVVWSYAGDGTSRCATAAGTLARPYFSGASWLPVTNVVGDVVTWDTAAFAYINGGDGTVEWAQAVYPTVAACPASLSSLTLSNHSDIVYALPGLGEVGAYLGDGIPQGFIDLFATDDGTHVFPAPPRGPAAAPAGGAGRGVLIPLSQAAMDGARAVHVARFFNSSIPGVAGGALTPTPSLYVTAVDQRDAAVGRVHFAWQFALPLDGTGLDGCAPPGRAGGPVADPSADPLLVAGPMGVYISPSGGGGPPPPGTAVDGAVVVALSCPAHAPAQAQVDVTTWLFAIAVDDAPPPATRVAGGGDPATAPLAVAPRLLWRVPVPAPAGSGGATQLFAHPAPPPGPGAPPLVWLAFGGGAAQFVQVDARTGGVAGVVNVSAAVAATPGGACAAAVGLLSFEPTGPVIASAVATAPTPSPAWRRSPAAAAPSATFLVPGTATSATATTSHWLAAVGVTTGANGVVAAAAGLWCAPVPVTAQGVAAPVRGQVVVVAHAGGGGAVFAAAPAGVVVYDFSPAVDT